MPTASPPPLDPLRALDLLADIPGAASLLPSLIKTLCHLLDVKGEKQLRSTLEAYLCVFEHAVAAGTRWEAQAILQQAQQYILRLRDLLQRLKPHTLEQRFQEWLDKEVILLGDYKEEHSARDRDELLADLLLSLSDAPAFLPAISEEASRMRQRIRSAEVVPGSALASGCRLPRDHDELEQ